jgi:Tol biopolymer transport system component
VVAQVAVSGGETVKMSLPFANASLNNISPDKTELVVGSFTGAELEQPLWAVPVVGGSPRRFADVPGEDGSWMPNGNLLVAHENKLIEVSSGGTSRPFAEVPDMYFSAWWLRWSPDFGTLRFTAGSPLVNTLWELPVNGGQAHQMLTGWREATNPALGTWTPDGEYYLFQAERNGRSDIWAIREKDDVLHKVNRQPVALTAGPLSFYSPQPSVDGKKIYAIGDQQRSELVRYDAKSGQFVPHLGGISTNGVAYSHDAQWVAYTSYPEGGLWRIRVDGTEKLQLTGAPLDISSFRWSPDGQQIAMTGQFPGKDRHMYLVSRDGGNLQEVPIQGLAPTSLSWCGKGNLIVISDGLGPNQSYVRTVDFSTREVKMLPDSKGLFLPHCSPDGEFITARSVDGLKLMVFNFASQKWSELVVHDVGFPEWSADSRYVYFDTGTSKELAIYRVRVADRKLERVASLENFRRVVNPWVSWMGLAPDDSPLLMRDVGSQEVYALDFEEP